ncbi:Pde9 [Drosophila busckii]|uniref:Pde9 n=1 Tax=Drosophila busckii TaxID=30019 RepID=A0A0M4ESH4_DROBS|nr:Pde9 [Drosophila busckii]
MARHNEILTQFIEITPVFDYNNRAHINLLCMILIKVADISNEARPMDVAEPWLDRLLQEFFAQSAAEKSEGLPVTPFMDPDKVSKPGSQVRFIGLVLLPLFEALGELVPELTELIIIPVRIALEYYRRLNDAQTKTRKSVADSATSDSNSGNMDSNAALIGTSMQSTSAAAAAGGGGASCSAGGSGGSGGAGAAGGGSPQMPRSGSGISVKSRRSAPTQKSASRTSMDEPSGMAAELHDLPEGSESGDSETATEVDVAEKTSKFKVDTEGCSNRSKSSHSNSRKSSREKRPSMIGELCSSGGGQRIRNSYGNIHGHGHPNRCHFGSNRAVSLDQYSSNNRRLSDGLPQVISDSNVFYGRGHGHGAGAGGSRQHEDHNMNTSNSNSNSNSNSASFTVIQQQPMQLAAHPVAQLMLQQQQQQQPQVVVAATTNGNVSPTLTLTQLQSQMSQPASNGSARSSAGTVSVAAAAAAAANVASGSGGGGWKSRLRQFSDYFSFSFDKNNKRFGSTRSSPCSQRGGNNNGGQAGQAETSAQALAQAQPVGASAATAPCCTISNNMQSGSASGGGQSVSRHRAYSLDVPCARHAATRYSSGDSSSRSHTQHSNHDSYSNSSTGGGNGASVGGGGGGVADLSGIRIRVAEAAGIGMSGVTTAMLQEERARLAPSVSCELGLASVSSSEAVSAFLASELIVDDHQHHHHHHHHHGAAAGVRGVGVGECAADDGCDLDGASETDALQQDSSSCEVSSISMTVWSAIGHRLNALVCNCCERKLPEPENV